MQGGVGTDNVVRRSKGQRGDAEESRGPRRIEERVEPVFRIAVLAMTVSGRETGWKVKNCTLKDEGCGTHGG